MHYVMVMSMKKNVLRKFNWRIAWDIKILNDNLLGDKWRRNAPEFSVISAFFIRLQKGRNSTRTPSCNTRCDQHKPRTSRRQSENALFISIEERLVPSASSYLSKKSFSLKYLSSEQEIHQLSKKSQQVTAMYQQTPSQGVVQEKFRLYYNDAKYCCITLGSGHTIDEWPLMPPEVRTILKQQKGKDITKRPIKKPHLSYGKRRQTYDWQRRADHYQTPSSRDRCALDDERAAYKSAL